MAPEYGYGNGSCSDWPMNRPGNRGLPLPAWHQQVDKIEHRLFSYISQNWRGKPLISHQVIIDLIAATTTTTGLTVKSKIDTNTYEKGLKVSDQQMAELQLREKSSMATGTISSYQESDTLIF